MKQKQKIQFKPKTLKSNTRVVYDATVDCPAIFYTLEYAADYYPYGKTLREFVNGTVEKYGYQGSEKDDELGSGYYYTHYRHLDSDIARWGGC